MNNTRRTADKKKYTFRFSKGFTLLELMVVIVIVGIMFSFLALSISGSSPAEAIKKEAQRLDQLIQIALEEAILRGQEYAIVFKPNSYQFARLTRNGWQVITDDNILRARDLPLDITIELEVEKSNFFFSSDDKESLKEENIEPQVYLMSSGEITPEFSVSLLILGIDARYQVTGTMNGEIESTPYVF